MIINALNRYYDLLVNNDKKNIPRYGYSVERVGFALNITLNGELLNLVPLMSKDGNKIVQTELVVPEHTKRTGNISPNFMCDNSTYMLGIDSKGKPERTAKAYLAFKKLHHKVLQSAEGEAAKAVLNFLDKWDIDYAGDNSVLKEYLDELFKGAN